MTRKQPHEWGSEEIAMRTYGKRPDQRLRDAEGSGPWLHNPKRPAPASAKWWPIGIGVFLAALGLALLAGGGQ